MKAIEFVKMVASGNDFVIIKKSPQSAVHSPQDLAKVMCDRRYGVGANGLLVLEKSKIADFKMRVFNPDGSEAEMCGNGARCVALYAKENKIIDGDMRIDTLSGIIEAKVSGDKVKIKMQDPKEIKLDFDLPVEGKDYRMSFVNTGVPHAVLFVQELESFDVKRLGRAIRYHENFAPRGTNVDFVEVEKGNSIKLRTYERGVEDETLACGTGCVASAIASSFKDGLKSPLSCLTKSGEKLKVYFDRKDNNFKNVYLEGGAKLVFYGRYLPTSKLRKVNLLR